MKKGLLIGALSFVAGVYMMAKGVVLANRNEDNEILFEDEKIKITETAKYSDGSRMAYIQMKDEEVA